MLLKMEIKNKNLDLQGVFLDIVIHVTNDWKTSAI